MLIRFVHLSLSKDSLYKTKVKADWGIRNMVTKKMSVPKLIPTLGEYLKKFGSIFLSQLIWDIQTRKVIIIQIHSERYGLVCFCSWVEIKLSGLAPLRVTESLIKSPPAIERHIQIDQF